MPLTVALLIAAAQASAALPSAPLTFGAFTARFNTDRTFTLEGSGWAPFKGTWSIDGSQVELRTPGVARGCDGPGRYTVAMEGARVRFSVIADDCEPRRMIYRQRLDPVGSGFSASPVAADGKIYLSNEDGEMIVVAAGREFKRIATNSIGELLMATPALSDGVMFVRSMRTLTAIGTSKEPKATKESKER